MVIGIPHNRETNKLSGILLNITSIIIAMYQAKAIDKPPPLGVGWICELLTFGISMIFFLVAIFITIMVPAYEAKNVIISKTVIILKTLTYSLIRIRNITFPICLFVEIIFIVFQQKKPLSLKR